MNLFESIKSNLVKENKKSEAIEKRRLKESVSLKEMGNFANRMDTVRAAGDRAATYRQDVSNQKNEKIKELFNRLKEIQDDVAELKEIGKHVKLYDLKDRYSIWLDASGRGLDYENPENPRDTLYVDTDKIQMAESYLALSEITADEMTKPNPFHHKNTFIKLATEMLDNYPGYIQAVNKMIDDYDLKYPVKSQEGVNESCEKKKYKPIKESNPAFYLGVTIPLNEKVNHANDDINAKIREALRSKTAARKYADEFKKAGITIDDSPREGVILTGPNGRKLSADRLAIIGPSRPGHNDTHGSRYSYNSIRSKRADIANYDKRIDENKKYIEELKNMGHDDIIRKYPDKSTEEALKAHEDRIASEENSLSNNKRWRNNVQKDINRERKYRSQGHDKVVSDNTIDRKSKSADKIDYKGYLDSKDEQDYKTYQQWGSRKLTPGEKVRNEFKNVKSGVHNTYVWNDSARRDLENKKIDSKAIEARKKEIEEEYKKKMDDEVNSMLQKKSDADVSYKEHKDSYNKNVKALNDFRAKHNLPTKDEDSFEDYIEKRAQSRY